MHITRHNKCLLYNVRLKDLSLFFHFNSLPYAPITAEQGKDRDTEERSCAVPTWSDSPPHSNAGCPGGFQDVVTPLQTLFYGAIDIPLAEQLGGSSKDGYFLGSSSNLPTASEDLSALFSSRNTRMANIILFCFYFLLKSS